MKENRKRVKKGGKKVTKEVRKQGVEKTGKQTARAVLKKKGRFGATLKKKL